MLFSLGTSANRTAIGGVNQSQGYRLYSILRDPVEVQMLGGSIRIR